MKELYNGVTEYVNSTTGLKYVVDHSVSESYLNRYAGVNPANGEQLWYDKNGNITNEFRESDKVMTGKTYDAPWMGGFGTSFRWKGLQLSAQFSWIGTRYVINNDRFFEESGVTPCCYSSQYTWHMEAGRVEQWRASARGCLLLHRVRPQGADFRYVSEV